MQPTEKVSFNPKTLYLWLGIGSLITGALISLIIFTSSIFASKYTVENQLTDHDKRIKVLETNAADQQKILYEIKFNLQFFIESQGQKYYPIDQLEKGNR